MQALGRFTPFVVTLLRLHHEKLSTPHRKTKDWESVANRELTSRATAVADWAHAVIILDARRARQVASPSQCCRCEPSS
jgi:hypothetical protein